MQALNALEVGVQTSYEHDRGGRMPSTSPLDRVLARVSEAPLRVGNQLRLLRDGPETYNDWLAAIKRAERWIHLENYIFMHDSTGIRFAEALSERAAAGVAVRVLVDWFGSLDTPASFWKRLRRNGVDVRIVNPPRLSTPDSVINRDHRKLLAVDGFYGSVGGVCIADEWLERSPVTGLPYRDTAVAVLGPAVFDIERGFSAVWQLNGSPLPIVEQPRLEQFAPVGEIETRVIIQEPGRMRMYRLLQVLLAAAEQRVWIADAYFLAAPMLREALVTAAYDGVDVRILLPATNDLPWVGALSRYGYRPLLKAGVRIWEYSGLMMHAKTSVADGWWSRIGSTNLNITGLETNWELDLVAEDRDFGAAMEAMYEQDLANAREIRLGGTRFLHPQPTRPASSNEKIARRQRQMGPVVAEVTAMRIGAALQSATGDVQGNERRITTLISGLLLGISLLAMRFPHLIAWPLAVLGSLIGGAGLVRRLREFRQTRPRRRIVRWSKRQPRRRNKRGFLRSQGLA
jgi:cardiolipin synthase